MVRMLIRSVAFLAMLLPAAAIAAQQEGHTMPGMPGMPGTQGADAALVTACVQSQQQVMASAAAANTRIELARQSNQPAALRAAVDDLQSVLSAMQTQLAPCAQLQASVAPAADPHAGHVMPNTSQAPPAPPGTPVMNPGSPSPASAAVAPPAAVDPHAGHVMPAAPAAQQPAAVTPPPAQSGAARPQPARPRTATPAPKPSAPAAAAAPRPTMVMVQTAFDPTKLTCSPKIDPKTAAKTTYQGKTYYFCSAKERDEFLTDPAMSLSMMPPKQ